MSVASRSHGEDRALLSTFVVPRFDAHLVQPQPFTTEDAYWQLILARLETRHALQQLRAQRATLLTTARRHAGGPPSPPCTHTRAPLTHRTRRRSWALPGALPGKGHPAR